MSASLAPPASRLPLITDPDKAIPFAPDLAVEVALAHQNRRAMSAKARRYLDAGTLLVWIVCPRWQQVDVWRVGNAQPSAIPRAGDALDGENVVPGFTYPVGTLFQ